MKVLEGSENFTKTLRRLYGGSNGFTRQILGLWKIERPKPGNHCAYKKDRHLSTEKTKNG